ncbi:MAG: hypothetical protein ACSLFF_03005 [Solirubrobacterales bacterium]
MADAVQYLAFDGNAAPAMAFHHPVFGVRWMFNADTAHSMGEG